MNKRSTIESFLEQTKDLRSDFKVYVRHDSPEGSETLPLSLIQQLPECDTCFYFVGIPNHTPYELGILRCMFLFIRDKKSYIGVRTKNKSTDYHIVAVKSNTPKDRSIVVYGGVDREGNFLTEENYNT